MSSVKTGTFTPLQPEDIVPGDPAATIWRWSARNGWKYAPDLDGGEPKIDPLCAWQLVKPDVTFKTAQNTMLNGIDHIHGLVKLSDVMRIKEAIETDD
ncbi:MAG TPA: hypothetical protein EYQ63_09175 [Fuerstia sp.]|nr:hypothetical protein [Fuerstiella sp.]